MRLVSRMCFELQGQSPCSGVRVQVQAFLSMSCVWRACVGHHLINSNPLAHSHAAALPAQRLLAPAGCRCEMQRVQPCCPSSSTRTRQQA